MNSYNINIQQGSSYNITLTATDSTGAPLNLSGYSARGGIKLNYGFTGYLINLQPQIDPSFVSGLINISVPPEQTSGLPITLGVYDIEAYNSGDYCFKVIGGYAAIDPQVSFY